MGEQTGVEWATHTYNEWKGCAKRSPACKNCYAEVYGQRFGIEWGPGKPRVRNGEVTRNKPHTWNRWVEKGLCGGCGHAADVHFDCCRGSKKCKCTGFVTRPRVFSASLSDWLDAEVPVEWLASLLATVVATPHLTWLLLTKRPELFYERVEAALNHLDGDASQHDSPWCKVRDWVVRAREPQVSLANVWVGTTVEDQRRADERIPQLLEIPARLRFLSCEPLLEEVDIRQWLCQARPGEQCSAPDQHGIGWIVSGGESGPYARPCHPGWARSLRDQCAKARTPFLWKQWGNWAPFDGRPGDWPTKTPRMTFADGQDMGCVGKEVAGRELDGVVHNAFPVSA